MRKQTMKVSRINKLRLTEYIYFVLSACVMLLGFIIFPILKKPLVGLILIVVFGFSSSAYLMRNKR